MTVAIRLGAVSPAQEDVCSFDAPTVPLVVDVDGTLLRGNLLVEGVIEIASRRPISLLRLPIVALGGKAGIKAFVAREARLDVARLPMNDAALRLISDARAGGRPVILASGAHESQVEALAAIVSATFAWGSNDDISLTGRHKLQRILNHTEVFDYVGNESVDLPLWAKARRAIAVSPSTTARWRARRLRPDIEIHETGQKPVWRSLLQSLRPHQWAKNALLLLPALAAHIVPSVGLAGTILLGLLAFCATASSVYVVNDLADLASDRVHATKRRRPFAAGDLSISTGMLLAAFLMLVGFAASVAVSATFSLVVGTYLLLTTAYTFVLKRRAILDVITLASLYTLRLVAGAALVEVPLSRWFLAFSIFFFFSLALVKRVVELRDRAGDPEKFAPGRGYAAADIPILMSLGTAAVSVSSLVYCLYITSEDVGTLYARPDLLWAALPILLYWQARVWLLTARGKVDGDPVVFAIRDRLSHVLGAVFLLILWGAS
jgi:4-hydroxybenzoate polyprenyltransferase